MKVLFITLAILLGMQVAQAEECISNNGGFQNWSYDHMSGKSQVSVSGHTYEVETYGGCYDLQWAYRVEFKSFSSFRTCRTDEIVVFDRDGLTVETCTIASIKRVR